MLEMNNNMRQCNICMHEHTQTHVEAMPGVIIYVCDNCLEAAKHNFIWICMNCGKVHIRSKSLVIKRINNYELKRALILCQDMQMIQGIDMCIECDPAGIVNYMKNFKMAGSC